LKDLHAKRTGFNAERITVIHNGVDRRRFFPDANARARVRRELNWSEDDFCIGSVGNLLPVKDHLTLLRAMEPLNGCGAWRLLVVGEGPERAALENFLNIHPECKPRTSLIGTSDRVPELLNALDVYVLPSTAEGISNSLLEAMATGLPVIATRTGGNPEVVVDGESGLLFPVGDFDRLTEELKRLWVNTDLRHTLGLQASRRVHSEFSIDSMIRKYDEVYGALGRKPATVSAVRVGA
jgi:glycosyltransferase involved in cell wall biosynthesis